MAKNERIEINNVFYLYAVGNSFVAIWTDPQGQWGTLPDYAKVEFTIERPSRACVIEAAIERAVREKVSNQRNRATIKQ